MAKKQAKRRKARELWIEWSHMSEGIVNWALRPLRKLTTPCGEIVHFREVLPRRKRK